MRTVIIDDEPYAIAGLRHELSAFPDISILGTYPDGQSFLEHGLDPVPDIIFLDVDMPEMSGFELVASMVDRAVDPFPKIIFVTAYPEHALHAFEVNASDYLVKPVTGERLEKTIRRLVTKPVHELEAKGVFHINTFGHVAFQQGANPIVVKWRSKKAEELFLYLLFQRGQFISKEKAATDLWPDLPQDRGLSNLYLSLYYIKRTVSRYGIPALVESMRGKICLLCDDCAIDFYQFDRYISRIDSILSDEKYSLVEELLSIYQGPFLDGYYFDWSEFARRYYEVKATAYCRELCAHLHDIHSPRLKEYENLLRSFEE